MLPMVAVENLKSISIKMTCIFGIDSMWLCLKQSTEL